VRADPATQAALARLAAGYGNGGGDGDHPSPDRLLAYHLGELPEPEAAHVQDHLVGCESCSEALLDLAELAAPDAAAAGMPDVERAAAWKQLTARRAQASALAGSGTSSGTSSGTGSGLSRPPRWRSLQALAAGLAVACLALSLWVVRLQDRLAQDATQRESGGALGGLSAPQANVPIAYLDAVTRGSAGDGEPVPIVPPARGAWILIVTPSDPRPGDRYRLEILDAAERTLHTVGGLTLSELGAVRAALPAGLLAPGDYRLRLAAETDAGSTLDGTADEYRLRVEPAEPGG
jgi:hypothetical protein